MKLTHVRVKDFRSFLGEHEFEVGDGVNYFVGPNNCGKSNLIRAVALALDPDAAYNPARDRPARAATVGGPPTTRITLTFKAGNTSPETTLINRAEAYEIAVRQARGATTSGGIRTYADDREIRVVTTFAGGGRRQTSFQAKGQGASSLPSDHPTHVKVESQFWKTVRFAVIRTGEDLETLLAGKFREILQLVIAEHLGKEMGKAETARTQYIKALQAELLAPLRDRIESLVQDMFPEISVASLVPGVPMIAATLSSVDVRLGDPGVTTQLTEKGTGVRGAVLIAMLQYLSEQSARSLVLAVEEPESFLHPAAQESVRDHLEQLAAPRDVSLLITTHSPYVISRRPDALIRELQKNSDGWTSTAATAQGDEARAGILGSLYRDSGMAMVLERALEIPAGTRAVLVTEGYTDGAFLRIGCTVGGRPNLVDGLHVIPSNGAKKSIVQAVLAKAATDLPVITLLDFDEHGRSAAKDLAEFGWKKERDLLSLGQWPERCSQNHDVEIEDLIPTAVAGRIVKRLGEANAIDRKSRCGTQWHISYSEAWKTEALSELGTMMAAKDTGGLIWLAEEINRRIDRIANSKAQAALHAKQ